MDEAKKMRRIERSAYSGILGNQRKKLCIDYQRTEREILNKTEKRFFQALAARGENISCQKGCSHCCYQHISATAAEGIVVVNFLYSHEHIKKEFIANYKQWQKTMGILSKSIDAAARSAIVNHQMLNVKGQELSKQYFELKKPCPFLYKSECMIYEVRPMACATYFSVNPSGECETGGTAKLLTYAMPEDVDLYKLWKLTDPTFNTLNSTLPLLIYGLLTEELTDVLARIR